MLVAMQLVFTQGRCSPLSRVFRIGYLFRKRFSQALYGCHPAVWLPPRSLWDRATIQHLAAYYLILTTHTQAWVGERGGGRDKAWGQGNNKGPRAGAWRPSAQKDFRE
jgi:hypothetical protein